MRVFGVSFDAVEDNAKFAAQEQFPFPLLCDVDRSMALAFGAAESASDAYPHRYTFVIAADGVLEHVIDTQDPRGQATALLAIL